MGGVGVPSGDAGGESPRSERSGFGLIDMWYAVLGRRGEREVSRLGSFASMV